jgi:hypothetical protein
MISEWWIGKDLKGSGHGLNEGTILAFACRDWAKPQKTQVRVAGLQAEIWSCDLQNTKQEC